MYKINKMGQKLSKINEIASDLTCQSKGTNKKSGSIHQQAFIESASFTNVKFDWFLTLCKITALIRNKCNLIICIKYINK